ncbi:MAG: glycine cleavage system protein GcvH [Methylococcaceae bacterium]|nr:MAG: glycine cleavage system protein GcvH [Methylococcaceae bacterium]
MGQLPEHFKYSTTHQWAERDGDRVRMGITEYAQEQLGDVVFIELPAMGCQVKQGEECATIESVKTGSGVHNPVSGIVAEVNNDLIKNPEQVNEQPYAAWLYCLKADDAALLDQEWDSLMSAAEYQAYLAKL